MTIEEMHIGIELGLNELGAIGSYDGMTPEEVDFFINKVVSRKVNSLLSKERDTLRLGFQGDQKRLDDIRTIVEVNYEADVETPLDPSLSYVFIELPDTYRNLINVRVRLYDLVCSGDKEYCIESLSTDTPISDKTRFQKNCKLKEIPARPIRQNIAHDTNRNPHTKSTEESPIVTVNGNLLQIFQNESYIVSGVVMDYIRKPSEVSLISNIDCDLADHVHNEIIDEVVNHILEVQGNPRYQSSSVDVSQSNA